MEFSFLMNAYVTNNTHLSIFMILVQVITAVLRFYSKKYIYMKKFDNNLLQVSSFAMLIIAIKRESYFLFK